MPESTCIKCGNQEFILHPITTKSPVRHALFVQCSNCGGVVGVLENIDIGKQFSKILDRLTDIENELP